MRQRAFQRAPVREALQHGSFTMDVLVAASATVTSSYGLGLVALCAVDGPNGQEVTELQMNAAHFLARSAPVVPCGGGLVPSDHDGV